MTGIDQDRQALTRAAPQTSLPYLAVASGVALLLLHNRIRCDQQALTNGLTLNLAAGTGAVPFAE